MSETSSSGLSGISFFDDEFNMLETSMFDNEIKNTFDYGYNYLVEKYIRGDTENVQKYITSGANINLHYGKYDKTPLHFASLNTDIKIVELLIEKGANVNAHDKDKLTPLHIAVEKCKAEIVKILIEHGADVNAQDRYKNTSLHLASEKCNTEIVKLLIEHGADVNVHGSYKRTPLNIASEGNGAEIVKILIEHGADVNARGKYNNTPLHDVVHLPYGEISLILVENRADVNALNKFFHSPLIQFLRFNKHFEKIKQVLENGFKINLPHFWNMTALHVAVYERSPSLMRLLHKYQADINARDKSGQTPLHHSVYLENKDNKDTTYTLLELGADINARDMYGNTPLHLAVRRGRLEKIKALFSFPQIDTTIQNNKGKTASMLTPMENQQATREVLLSRLAIQRESGCVQENPTNECNNSDVSPTSQNNQASKAVSSNERKYISEENRVIIGESKGKPISYTPSKFVRKFKADRYANLDQLDAAVRALDKKISLQKSDPLYQQMVDEIRGIVQIVCTELSKNYSIFENVVVIGTGSSYTGVKVGLPYEADFLLKVECSSGSPEFYNCTNGIYSVLETRDLLIDKNQWIIKDIKRCKVGVTVCFHWKPYADAAESECSAFSIDIVPAYKPAIEDIQQIQLGSKAEEYLKSKGLLDSYKTDLLCLVSSFRDNAYDTCLIVNKILKSLDEDVKLGYRVAKYLLQNRVIWNWVPQSSEEIGDLKLSGYDPIVKSFHFRLCFLHLLFAVHGTMLAKELTGATLALCLLDMLRKCFKQVADFDQPRITDPINNNPYVVNFEKIPCRPFYCVSEYISKVAEKFKSDALSGDLSHYKLLNFPAYNLDKSDIHVDSQSAEQLAKCRFRRELGVILNKI